jgi:hypothetical protein
MSQCREQRWLFQGLRYNWLTATKDVVEIHHVLRQFTSYDKLGPFTLFKQLQLVKVFVHSSCFGWGISRSRYSSSRLSRCSQKAANSSMTRRALVNGLVSSRKRWNLPVLIRWSMPALSSTLRCLEIAAGERVKGLESSETVQSDFATCERILRRVASARA